MTQIKESRATNRHRTRPFKGARHYLSRNKQQDVAFFCRVSYHALVYSFATSSHNIIIIVQTRPALSLVFLLLSYHQTLSSLLTPHSSLSVPSTLYHNTDTLRMILNIPSYHTLFCLPQWHVQLAPLASVFCPGISCTAFSHLPVRDLTSHDRRPHQASRRSTQRGQGIHHQTESGVPRCWTKRLARTEGVEGNKRLQH